jgi:hypothetical protein
MRKVSTSWFWPKYPKGKEFYKFKPNDPINLNEADGSLIDLLFIKSNFYILKWNFKWSWSLVAKVRIFLKHLYHHVELQIPQHCMCIPSVPSSLLLKPRSYQIPVPHPLLLSFLLSSRWYNSSHSLSLKLSFCCLLCQMFLPWCSMLLPT